MTRAFIFLVALGASPAAAQTYVAAALGADSLKSYESTTNGTTFPDGDRDAVGWGLRVGTALGSRWGVELEFNRSGELEMRQGPIYTLSPLALSTVTISSTSVALEGLSDLRPTIFPAPEIRTQQRNTIWNASAWVRQPLGARADLVILGGLGFSRVGQDTEYSFGGAPRLASLIPVASRTQIINYGVGPMVGAEARIGMTDHLELTPGLRVQSLGNQLSEGLLLRPSVALGWTF